MTAPFPERPARQTDASWPPGGGFGWPTLADWPGYNVPVDPDEASIILRIRQAPAFLPSFGRANIQVNGKEVFAEWRAGVIEIGGSAGSPPSARMEAAALAQAAKEERRPDPSWRG